MFGVWRNGQYRRSQYAVDIDSQRSRELGGPMQIRTLHHFHQLRTFIMVDDSYPSGGRGWRKATVLQLERGGTIVVYASSLIIMQRGNEE
jgi:hypothetical protein